MVRVLIGILLLAQTADEKPVEVRIRSAVYMPPVSKLSVETKLVEVGVTVRDRQGQPAGGFRQTDFEILDNGRPQSIAYFSEEYAGGSGSTLGSPPVTS